MLRVALCELMAACSPSLHGWMDQSGGREQCSPIGSLQAKKPQARGWGSEVLCRRLWKQYYSRWQLHVQCFEKKKRVIIFTKRNNDSPSDYESIPPISRANG